MALKWLFFFFGKKLQELPSSWGLHPQASLVVTCSLTHNLHNQQVSRLLLYTQFQHKQMQQQNAIITTKPCLTITVCIFING